MLAYLARCTFLFTLLACHQRLLWPTQAVALSSDASSKEAYAFARRVRTLQGHQAALPLYEILRKGHSQDYSAATHLAASTLTPTRQDQACCCDRLDKIEILRKSLLMEYTHTNIKALTKVPPEVVCQGPIYLIPVTAGSSGHPPIVESKLDCLVSLFLLGFCVHVNTCQKFLGQDALELLQDLGLAFVSESNTNLVVPHVHLFPLDLSTNQGTLILATDLHPRVLSTTTVGTQSHGAVMYIGPDSLALVQNIPSATKALTKVLDLCTGSGIQALAALATSTTTSPKTATCMDINPRALQFTRFNAALNGLSISTLLGDLMLGSDTSFLQDSYDLILANPPFIPVPPTKDIIQRYGLFSSGGADGEVILRQILQLASMKLTKGTGVMAIVSEFMNPNDATLLDRLETWWGNSTAAAAATGILLTNEVALDDETYAARRADSQDEYHIWLEHLRQYHITHVSPGLLFVQALDGIGGLELKHHIVPKTQRGSIWTPSNTDAIAFIRETVSRHFASINRSK